MNWKKIHVHGQQGFPVSQSGGPDAYKPFPGVFEMWIYDTPTWMIELGLADGRYFERGKRRSMTRR